jgi:NADPH:quinone reductase-like Zn-dependent oxidoreductase
VGLGEGVVDVAVRQSEIHFFLADLDQADLGVLRHLMEAGKVTPVIDRTYALSETPAAMGYLEQGHARGKVVVMVN